MEKWQIPQNCSSQRDLKFCSFEIFYLKSFIVSKFCFNISNFKNQILDGEIAKTKVVDLKEI